MAGRPVGGVTDGGAGAAQRGVVPGGVRALASATAPDYGSGTAAHSAGGVHEIGQSFVLFSARKSR